MVLSTEPVSRTPQFWGGSIDPPPPPELKPQLTQQPVMSDGPVSRPQAWSQPTHGHRPPQTGNGGGEPYAHSLERAQTLAIQMEKLWRTAAKAWRALLFLLFIAPLPLAKTCAAAETTSGRVEVVVNMLANARLMSICSGAEAVPCRDSERTAWAGGGGQHARTP